MNPKEWIRFRAHNTQSSLKALSDSIERMEFALDCQEIYSILKAELESEHPNTKIYMRANGDQDWYNNNGYTLKKIDPINEEERSLKFDKLLHLRSQLKNIGDLEQEDYTRVSFTPDGQYLIRRVRPFTLENKTRDSDRGRRCQDSIRIPETYIYYGIGPKNRHVCYVSQGRYYGCSYEAWIGHPHIYRDIEYTNILGGIYIQRFCTGDQLVPGRHTHDIPISSMTASIFGDMLESIYRTHNPHSPANSSAFEEGDECGEYDDDEDE